MNQPTFPFANPRIIETGIVEPESEEDLFRCPVCDNLDTLDGFDCLGADRNCVFCNNCQTELSQT